MKKLLMFLFVMVPSFASFAQTGVVKTLPIDTLDNTAPRTSSIITASGQYNSLAITALCTQLGGTSDGSLTLQGSVDGTSYVALTDYEGFSKGYANDTLTMTNGAIGQWAILKTPFIYYKIKYAPSGSHTTRVTAKYIYK